MIVILVRLVIISNNSTSVSVKQESNTETGEEAMETDNSSSKRVVISLNSAVSEEVGETTTTDLKISRDRPSQSCIRLSSAASGSGGRRFSNVSNLAFELGNATSSAPRLQVGGGSLELGFVLEKNSPSEHNHNKNSMCPSGGAISFRRTLSALETSSGPPLNPASIISPPQ